MKLMSDNFRIFLALLHREMLVFRSKLFPSVIDSFILLLMEVTLLGYLFPLLGMPAHLILPLYLGNMILIIIEKNFATAFNLIFDIRDKGLITYHITLPLPKRWLFAAYLTKEIVKTIILTVPLFFIGLFLLGSQTQTVHFPLQAFLMYGIMLLFIATLFLMLGFWYESDWFLINVWPRRLNPLISTGCIFFTWGSIASFSPLISKFLLLNPFTYVTEGLRGALLGQANYLSLSLCFFVVTLTTIFLMWLLGIGVKRRLDCI